MRIIALDIGTKSCGVALSDPMNIIAQAKENINFNEKDWNSMFKNLDKYFKKYKINKIIIGYPTLPSGKKSKTTLMIEDLEIIIKKRYSLPIKRIEENFSTKKAHEILIYSGIKRKKRKNLKDKIAAQIILTNYLKTL